MIEEDHVGRDRRGRSGNLFQLSFADQRGRLRAIAMLRELSCDLRARAARQAAEFVERVFPIEVWRIRSHARRVRSRCMIASCLRSRRNRRRAYFSGAATTRAEFHPHQEGALLLLGGIHNRLGCAPGGAVSQPGFISSQTHFILQCRMPRWRQKRPASPRRPVSIPRGYEQAAPLQPLRWRA